MPTISVVMPVYKVESYIEASVTSVCSQSYNDFELILVDDCGGDRSIDIALTILSKHNIAYSVIHHKINKGVSAARNTGIRVANGDWVICIDPDDCIHPQTFEILSAYMDNSETDVIAFDFQQCTTIQRFDKNTGHLNVEYYDTNTLAFAFLVRTLKLIAPAMLIRRSFLDETCITYNEKVFFSEDLLFIWHLIPVIKRLCFINEKLYYYVVRPNSTMTGSSVSKILTGIRAFQNFNLVLTIDERYKSLQIDTRLIYPRWLLGVFHSSAKQMQYENFCNLIDMVEYKLDIELLKSFPKISIQIFVRLLLFNTYIFFRTSKII